MGAEVLGVGLKRKGESRSPPISFAVQAQFVNRSVFILPAA